MAKSKRKSGSKSKNHKVIKPKEEKKEEINIDAQLEIAESLVIKALYEEAEQKLNEILSIDENNIKALEMLANVYTDSFEKLKAINVYKKLIDVAPDVGYQKYFDMGQFHEGEESIAFYEKGIQVIEKELKELENNASSNKKQKVIIRDLSRAYCSISEIYTTDCCDLENAEEKCREAIENAIKTDPSNPEGYQSRASLFLIERKDDEAKEDMRKSFSLWSPLLKLKYEMNNEDEHDKELEELLVTVTRSAMLAASKLLIEVGMYDEAKDLLEACFDEDDEDVEVCYLLGIMYYDQGEEYDKAHDYLERANGLIERYGCPYDDIKLHVKDLIEELKKTHPLSDDDDEDDNDDDDEEDDEDELDGRFDEALALETESEGEMEVN